MKQRNSFIKPALIAATLLAAAALNTQAQNWQTIVALSDPNVATTGNAILVDRFSVNPASPGLFIGGESAYGPVLHVNQSSNPANAVTPADTVVGHTYGLVQDAAGNLYSCGGEQRNNRGYWQVRRSSNGGATWSVVDDASSWNSAGGSQAMGLTTDSAGNVFASGSASDKLGNVYWVIRKGSNLGSTWSTSYKSGKLATGKKVVFVNPIPGGHAGGLFAVGSLTATKTTQWSVLRSRDSGATWQWVDAWGTSKLNGGAYARAITADVAGNIYVAGYDVMGVPAWYVRRSRDGGNTWQTILTEYTAGDYNRADDIAADPAGNIYVAGMTQQTGSGAKWTVRRWDAAMQTWDQWPTELRHPLLGYANVSVARGITTDAFRSVYATGDADGQWLVQKLMLP